MTNSGMFEDPEKIEYLENQNKLLKQKLKEAVSKIKRIQGLEEHHAKNNGDLRIENKKLEKEIFTLKKDIEILREGNEHLGIFRQN
jgi:predicted  nucleic acid-binding Zn-ribbon protein